MRTLRGLISVLLLLCTETLLAQAMSSITPNYGPTTGGSDWTIVGTGFSTVPKSTRFVDADGVVILSSYACTSTTLCTGYARSGLVPPGQIKTFAVFAEVNGVRGGTSRNFIYYGPPVITSVTPNSGPRTSSTPVVIAGRGFPSTSNGFPGTTSIYLLTAINDFTNGCGSTTQCNWTAPAIVQGNPNGVYNIDFRTPGGATTAEFTYAPPAPPTPTIASVTPNKGKRDGGNTVTIVGTGFNTTALKTLITFETTGIFGGGGQATSVACASTTQCTATVPGGNGKADIRVSTTTAGTPGSNSAVSVKSAASKYTYAGIDVQPGYGTTLYTHETGTTAMFTEALTTPPTSTVTVALTLTGFTTEATRSPASLTFTPANWNVPQIVTLTGLDDVAVDSNRGYAIASQATSADLDYNNTFGFDQNFANIDNEVPGFFVGPSQNLITTETGRPGSFTVFLNTAPSATVTVNLASSDPTEGAVNPTSLTFATTTGGTNGWNVPRTVSVSGIDDVAIDGDVPYSVMITHTTTDPTYAAAFVNDVQVTNIDAEGAALAPPVHGDFNGDGKDDVLLRHLPTGAVGVWLMNGMTISGGGLVGAAPITLSLAGIGDFNGDNKSDILWRDAATGDVGMWLMNGAVISGGGLVGSADPSLLLAGLGDFNGDNKTDILWRHPTNGLIGMWLMNGISIGGGGSPGSVDPALFVAGIGDFNGDNRDDILWRDRDRGDIGMWMMNGLAISAGGYVGPCDTSLLTAGIADFNGDGRDDILLRHAVNGGVGMWQMNGAAIIAGGFVGNSPPALIVASVGDYNGDLMADILWNFTPTGDVGMWQMAGTNIAAGGLVGGTGPGYEFH